MTFSVVTGSAILSRRYRDELRTHYMATGGSPVLPVGSLTCADRHGGRVYLTAWVPLYTQSRRPDASR